MSNEYSERITCALGHVTNKSIQILPREQWEKIILADGEPTLLVSTRGLGMDMTNACVVAVAASGVQNLNPGADVVRYDAKDYPHIYNTDHYTVIEQLSNHPKYEQILKVVGVKQSESLQQILDKNVFIVGPEKIENHHWQKEILPQIRNGKWKE